jgi:hypothetical protein
MTLLYKLVGGLALLLAAYIGGRFDGSRIEQGAQARVERKARELTIQLEDARQESTLAHGKVEAKAQTQVREIYRETEKLVQAPAYTGLCVDAGGLRMLDDAASVANRKDRREPASGAAGATEGPTDGRQDDRGGLHPVDP